MVTVQLEGGGTTSFHSRPGRAYRFDVVATSDAIIVSLEDRDTKELW